MGKNNALAHHTFTYFHTRHGLETKEKGTGPTTAVDAISDRLLFHFFFFYEAV